ncbi:hypothetical protein GQ55_6G077200 [Panicum hallii var. hallii]|uniref:Uncharacterized protein n=1 Tax=Panicum hallii var. hallii TaxID=1504633 RepID=A0A2T7D502_9POAL|nr:hypothetical protein GQ55_6G077200 [Panicum hallii var. hallii]PUZ50674.1 hypothetical protein GQ55_6G077200 [Panicum hallii var. hallii]
MGFTGSLKRAREEKGAPMASRIRDPRPEVTTQDALRFLATMKRELADDTKKYDEFITVVVEFKDGRMDATSLIEHVTVLLAGHPDLLRGFDKFVPSDYKISHGQEAGAK